MDETRDGTVNHGFTTFKRVMTANPLRRIALVAATFTTLITAPVQANQWSLLVNGKAVHLEKPAGTDYNEANWGAGIQYDFHMTDSKWIPFVTASGFKDSNKNPSYYAGGGSLRRFTFGEANDSLHLDAGVVAFFMIRKDYHDGKPFPGILPVVAFGTNRVALNMTYIPKVDPKMVPILFFQLKIGINVPGF